MLVKKIAYTDFLGNRREEEFYFNYTKADTNRLMFSTKEGLQAFLQRIIREEDRTKLFGFIEEFILGSYGEISPDGRQFIKSEQLSTSFKQTNAYSELIEEIVKGGDEAFAEFVRGVLPKDLVDTIDKVNNEASPVVTETTGTVTPMPAK